MRKIILVSVLAVLVGCALGPMYRVKIDSISGLSTATKKTYILLPGVKDVEPNDLQFKEYSSYVERALSSAGYVRAENPQNANIAVFLSYGIGDPKDHQYSYSLPVWGQTGVASSTTYGTISSYGSSGVSWYHHIYTELWDHRLHNPHRLLYYLFQVHRSGCCGSG
ncbi:MAG TPA: hypothetical protein PLB96_14090 [Syntrophales bacterium]|nr:hypothetical protein [Syntrophales bacterium]